MSLYNTGHFYEIGKFRVDKNVLMHIFIILNGLTMYLN